MKGMDELDLYTPIEEAKEEIKRRWNNTKLQKKVKEYVGSLPLFLLAQPKACIFRFITTPNFELFKFLELAEQVHLPALSAEYTNDHFVSQNCDKHALGKLPIFRKRNHKGESIFTYKTIVNFTKYGGKPLRATQTLWNEPLIDFHHALLRRYALKIEIADASGWLHVNGERADEYYSHYLALFICYGILFENFITNEEEERFSKSVVFPAFRQVVDHFGLKPLIVQLVPHDVASDIYWRCYPAELEDEVLRCLSKCKAKDSLAHRHAGRCAEKDSGQYGSKRDKK